MTPAGEGKDKVKMSDSNDNGKVDVDGKLGHMPGSEAKPE
jgi:hypothetical protein